MRLVCRVLAQRINRFPKFFQHRCVSTAKTYYDSQSGRYMKIPGSDGFKVHDVSMKLQSLNHIKVNLNDIYSHYQNLLTKNEISSVSFDVFDSSNGYKNYDKDIAYNDIALLTSNDDTTCEQFNLSHTSVTIQTCVDFNNLVDILGERGQGTSIECKRPFHLEVDCLSLTSLTFDDTPDSVAVQGINSIRGLDFCISEQQLSDQFKLRVNLYLDITSILHGHVDKASKPAPSPLSVMSAVGHLCDLREVEVVTLVLCSALPLSTLLADDSLCSSTDDLAEYVREVLEECIGLDVAGTAAVDRLGLQGSPLQVNETAVGLGIRRFNALCDLEGLSRCASLPLLDREIIVDGSEDGQRLFCLTSALEDIRHLVKVAE